jgi:hypothetical protein
MWTRVSRGGRCAIRMPRGAAVTRERPWYKADTKHEPR